MFSGEYICWSCSSPLSTANARDGCREPAILLHPAPKSYMRRCGQAINTKEIPAEGPFSWPCCKCHEEVEWRDIDHFLIGPCPSCHAWGMFGEVEE